MSELVNFRRAIYDTEIDVIERYQSRDCKNQVNDCSSVLFGKPRSYN
jgi:hypothetical protein